jgi:hypothetical protein
MISNDRFPDVPMVTQGVNPWHDQSLGSIAAPDDGTGGNQNIITLGPKGGMQWQKARVGTDGSYHSVDTDQPEGTIVRPL